MTDGLGRATVTVVITTYNRSSLLRDCLQSVFAQERTEFELEVVVVDNASTDATASVVAALQPPSGVLLRYVVEPRKGVAPARNRGLAEATGSWIAFFDDDQIASPRWLSELLAAARHTDAQCVGGRMLLRLPAGHENEQLARVPRALLGETFQGDLLRPYPPKELPGTGNVLISRSLLGRVAEFDEHFTAGCEDADFFRRVRASGLVSWYAPAAVAYHVVPEYRLGSSYLLWVSLRQGLNYAYLDHKERGLPFIAVACAARVLRALVLTSPRLFWTAMRGDGAGALGHRCLLWRTIGYARETLHLVSPHAFRQRGFFEALEFRAERSHSGAPGSTPR